jgi:hypothetical protein
MAENNKIDIRDVYTDKTKSVKVQTVNFIKRYGYWAMIIVLFVLAILLSFITVGDVYQRMDLTEEEIFNQYVNSGHVLSEHDELIVKDLITEAFANDEIIPYYDYDKFIQNINSYAYDKLDGTQIRFDSLIFYLYTKIDQQFINFEDIPKWQIVLIIMNGVLGVLVTVTFMQTGLQDALITPSLKEAKNNLSQASADASKKRLMAEKYFAMLYQQQLESVRRTELSLHGLIYEDYFNEEGRFKNSNYDENIQKILNKVLKLKIAQLSFDLLATNIGTQNNVNKLIGLKDYTSKTAIRSIVSKIFAIVFFTFVSVSLIVSARTPLQMFMHLISTILMFAAGVLEYLNSYSFVVEEYVETINSKTRHLGSFISYCNEEEKLANDTRERLIKMQIEKEKLAKTQGGD